MADDFDVLETVTAHNGDVYRIVGFDADYAAKGEEYDYYGILDEDDELLNDDTFDARPTVDEVKAILNAMPVVCPRCSQRESADMLSRIEIVEALVDVTVSRGDDGQPVMSPAGYTRYPDSGGEETDRMWCRNCDSEFAASELA